MLIIFKKYIINIAKMNNLDTYFSQISIFLHILLFSYLLIYFEIILARKTWTQLTQTKGTYARPTREMFNGTGSTMLLPLINGRGVVMRRNLPLDCVETRLRANSNGYRARAVSLSRAMFLWKYSRWHRTLCGTCRRKNIRSK